MHLKREEKLKNLKKIEKRLEFLERKIDFLKEVTKRLNALEKRFSGDTGE